MLRPLLEKTSAVLSIGCFETYRRYDLLNSLYCTHLLSMQVLKKISARQIAKTASPIDQFRYALQQVSDSICCFASIFYDKQTSVLHSPLNRRILSLWPNFFPCILFFVVINLYLSTHRPMSKKYTGYHQPQIQFFLLTEFLVLWIHLGSSLISFPHN